MTNRFSKSMFKLSMFVVSLIISHSAMAASTTYKRLIEEIVVFGDGGVEVRAAPVGASWNDSELCDNHSRIVLLPDSPFYSEQYALLMAAKLKSLEVRAVVNSCYTNADGRNYPIIERLWLY